MKKRLPALVLALCLLCGLAAPALAAPQPTLAMNRGRQDYTSSNWADTVHSYLFDSGDGTITRVEGRTVEVYDKSDLLWTGGLTLEEELPLWGGFFAGEDYNFCVYGQENRAEDDSAEVIRVVKYSKDWRRLGAASLYGANTTVPFDAGSLRMAEHNGILYLRTCHEMYAMDGVNHQANLALAVRQSDMKITGQLTGVEYSPVGYVSHSFNQFVAVDEDGLMAAVDHGDAYPRSVVLTRYQTNSGGTFAGDGLDQIDLLEIPGRIGENYTGVTVGGLAFVGDHILVAGTCVSTGGRYDREGADNLFVVSVPKRGGGVSLTWLTDNRRTAEGDTGFTGTPHLVGLGDGTAMLLAGAPATAQRVDEYGKPLGEAVLLEGADLSSCAPVLTDGKLLWYSGWQDLGWKPYSPTFYTLDPETMELTAAEARAGRLERITRGRTYTPGRFADVGDAWYTDNVAAAYEFGLMEGTSADHFNPGGTLTVGEAVALAARIYARYAGENPDFSGGNPWYAPYVAYAKENEVLPYDRWDGSAPCSRQIFFLLMAYAVSPPDYAPLERDAAQGYPQVVDGDSFGGPGYSNAAKSLWSAGVVTGIPAAGGIALNPDGIVTRAEAAAMITRLVDPELRIA